MPDDETRPPGHSDAPPDASGPDLAKAALARARAAARAAGRTPTSRTSGTRGRRTGRSPGSSTNPANRSGAGPDERDPQTLDTLVSRLLAERGWETDVAVAGVLSRWEQLVGPELATHCRAEGLEDGVLTVVTRSTAWATQVRLLAPQLVRRLNEQLGHGTVQRVRVRGPEAPSWRHGGRSVPGRGPRDTYG